MPKEFIHSPEITIRQPEQKETEALPRAWFYTDKQGQEVANALERAFRHKEKSFQGFIDLSQMLERIKSGAQPEVIFIDDTQADFKTNPIGQHSVEVLQKLREAGANDILISSFTTEKPIGRRLIEQGANFYSPMVTTPKDLERLMDRAHEIAQEKTTRQELNKQVEAFYDEHAKDLDPRSEVTAATKEELDLLLNFLKAAQESSDNKQNQFAIKDILDAGCGNGRLAIYLAKDKAGYNVTGIDLSSELIQTAKEKAKQEGAKVKLLKGDLKELPFTDANQDVVMYNWHVFAHLIGEKAKQEALNEAYRVLKPGGLLIFDMPNIEAQGNLDKGSYTTDNDIFKRGKVEVVHKTGKKTDYQGEFLTKGYIFDLLSDYGFEDIEFIEWEVPKTGFKKLTVKAKKFEKDI